MLYYNREVNDMSEKVVNVVFKTIFDRLPNLKDKNDQDTIQNLACVLSCDGYLMFHLADNETGFICYDYVWENSEIKDILKNQDQDQMVDMEYLSENYRNSFVVKVEILKDALNNTKDSDNKEMLLKAFCYIHYAYNDHFCRSKKSIKEYFAVGAPKLMNVFDSAYQSFQKYQDNMSYKNREKYLKKDQDKNDETYLLSEVNWAFTKDGEYIIPFVREKNEYGMLKYQSVTEINTSVQGDSILNIGQQEDKVRHNRVPSTLWNEKCNNFGLTELSSFDMLTKYMNKNRNKENLIQFVTYEYPKTVVNMNDIRKLKHEFQSNIQRQYGEQQEKNTDKNDDMNANNE